MAREKFLVTDLVPEGFFEELQEMGFDYEHVAKMNTAELEPVVHLYEGIVINTAMNLDKKMLDKASKLRYVLRPGSGLDNIDVEYAKTKQIVVFNSPEGNKEAVGEHAMGLLLSLMNYIPRAFGQVKNLEWIRQPNTGTELKGKTVGIIGYGNTGSAFAKKLSGFGTQILVYDKYKPQIRDSFVSPATEEDIFEMADVISFHVPLNSETKHFFDDAYMENFHKPIYLLNTSRGGVVNLESVTKGIKIGKILGAGLDVLENENIPNYTDSEKQKLLELINAGNVIITPHIAGWTHEARSKIFFIVLDKFREWLQSGSQLKLHI